MSCPNIANEIRKASRRLDEDWNRIKSSSSGFFALDSNILNSFFDKLANYSAAIARAAIQILLDSASSLIRSVLTLITMLLTSHEAMKLVMIYYALIGLNNTLKRRVLLLAEIRKHVSNLEMFVRILEKYFYSLGSDQQVYIDIRNAMIYIKRAAIAANKVQSYLITTGRFSTTQYNNVLNNITRAQSVLTDYETSVYDNLVNEALSNYNVPNAPSFSDPIDRILWELENSKAIFNARLKALEELIENEISDVKTKVIVTYKLTIKSLEQLAILTPYSPTEFIKLASSWSIVGSLTADQSKSIIGNIVNSLDNNTLLEMNVRTNEQINALKNINNKWDRFKNLVQPYVEQFVLNSRELGIIYREMKTVVEEQSLSKKDVLIKKTNWTLRLESLKNTLKFTIPEGTAEYFGDATRFESDLNVVLEYIDEYDTESSSAQLAFSELLTVYSNVLLAFAGQSNATLAKNRLSNIRFLLNSQSNIDRQLIYYINNLRLPENAILAEIYEALIEVLEKSGKFPELVKLLKNGDIALLSEGVSSVLSEGKAALQEAKSFYNVLRKNKIKGLTDCLAGSNINIDLNFSLDSDKVYVEEDVKQYIDQKNYVEKNQEEYNTLLDFSIGKVKEKPWRVIK